MLTKLVNKKGSDWDMKLGPVLIANRRTPQSYTKVSPFYFIMGVMQEYPLH